MEQYNGEYRIEPSTPKKRRKKKKKKPSVLQKILYAVAGGLITLVLLFSCAGGDDKKEDTATKETSAPAAEASVELSNTPVESQTETTTEQKSIPLVSESELIERMHQAMNESGMEGTASIEDVILVIRTYNSDLAADLTIAAMGDETALASYEKMKESFASASASARQTVKELGYEDMHVSIMVMNPINEENAFLMTLDNVIVYDAMEEIREEMEKKN